MTLVLAAAVLVLAGCILEAATRISRAVGELNKTLGLHWAALNRSTDATDRTLEINRQILEALKYQRPPIVVSPGNGILS